jgi:signal peptidase I
MESMPVVKRRKRRIWLALLPVFAALLWYGSSSVGYVANMRAFVIPPGAKSMSPALLPGDRIAVDIRGGTPNRGEIWVFSDTKTTMVKRVIGLPGETVEVAGGKVLIDGKPLAESYPTTPIGYTMPPVRLGPDEYFVLGDSRNGSLDSHTLGPLPHSRLVGRAEHRIWPKDRIGPLH